MVQEVQKLVDFFVRHERHVELKTEVAARRLESMEKEKDEEEDEANLDEAVKDNFKVSKMVVDKWFVGEVFGFGKVKTGKTI